jgi:hypothetical protein
MVTLRAGFLRPLRGFIIAEHLMQTRPLLLRKRKTRFALLRFAAVVAVAIWFCYVLPSRCLVNLIPSWISALAGISSALPCLLRQLPVHSLVHRKPPVLGLWTTIYFDTVVGTEDR